ncbi:TPA: hypothetical protein ACKP5U_000921 [Pseudomonas aeruginosa]|nr:hypothetical protein [Pseudomonas aeruginosa]WOA79993.1 hypothetical protein RX577_19510 [Pseudomonas aeruginosa]
MRDQVHFLPVLSGPLETPLSDDDADVQPRETERIERACRREGDE